MGTYHLTLSIQNSSLHHAMRLPLWSLVLGVLAHSVLHAANAPPEIRNLKAQQRPGTYLVDITFDLVDPDSFTGVFLSVEASVDNGTSYNLPAKTVTGDVRLVKPGTGKKIVWDAFADWPDKYTTAAKVRVVATDSLPQGPGPGPEGFVWIPEGKFTMGSSIDSNANQHEVYISPGFWLSDHETTQAEWESIFRNNPSSFKGANRPVEQISWDEAVAYCVKLTERDRAAGRITSQQMYRLPTESEWEYAARAGSTKVVDDDIGYIAWWSINSNNQTHDVRKKAPNAWGVYDALGNVWELCLDLNGAYPIGPVVNPKGPTSGTGRVMRGYSFSDSDLSNGVAARSAVGGQDVKWFSIGFRIALVSVEP